jgi:multiple sugar transport system substrate-binding protein
MRKWKGAFTRKSVKVHKPTRLSSTYLKKQKDTMWKIKLFSLTLVLFFFFTFTVPLSAKTSLRFVTWKPNQPAVWNEAIERFEKENPDIEVVREVGPHSSTEYHALLTQKLKNRDTSVDLFFMDVVWPPEFASAGWALPLDTFFPKSEQKKFLQGPILANTYEGHIYGVPVWIASGMLYYRKDLLKKYGFEPPKTWDEMIIQAKQIVNSEKTNNPGIIGFSGQFKQYEGLITNIQEYILSNNARIIDDVNKKPEINNVNAINALKFIRDKIIFGIASRGLLTYEEPESLDLFVQGKAVFHRNWPYAWEVANNPLRSAIAEKVGIGRLPHFKGGKSFATLGGWQFGISRFSEKPDVAWRFIAFMTSEKMQKFFALKASLSPTRKALYKDWEIRNAQPQFDSMFDVFLTAYPRPRSPLYPMVSNILQSYFHKAISDSDSDIENLANKAAKDLNRVLNLAR